MCTMGIGTYSSLRCFHCATLAALLLSYLNSIKPYYLDRDGLCFLWRSLRSLGPPINVLLVPISEFI